MDDDDDSIDFDSKTKNKDLLSDQESAEADKMEAWEEKLLQVQDRLPFWDDKYFEQANPIVRSGLFAISNRKAFYEEFTPVRVLGDGKIEKFGPSLKVFDETVMLQLTQYFRGQRLSRPIEITRRQLMKELGLASSGKSYKRLEDSLERLNTAKMRISSKAVLKKLVALMTNPKFNSGMDPDTKRFLESNYGPFRSSIERALARGEDYFITMGFINNFGYNGTSGGLVVKLDPLMILILDGIHTARIGKEDREALAAPAAIRLLGYFMSHSVPIYDQKLASYHSMLGSTTKNMTKFRKDFINWMTQIEAQGRIEPGWSVDSDMVRNVVPRPYTKD